MLKKITRLDAYCETYFCAANIFTHKNPVKMLRDGELTGVGMMFRTFVLLKFLLEKTYSADQLPSRLVVKLYC